jgi:hypothetical protein
MIFEEAFPDKKNKTEHKIYYEDFRKMMHHLAF